jgi:endoglucanase
MRLDQVANDALTGSSNGNAMHYPTDHFLGRQRNGLNHVSMNLSGFDRNNGPVQGTNYPVYSDQLLDWYRLKRVESVRLLFTWEAVQSARGGPVPSRGAGYATYWADLIDVVKRLLARGIYVIVGPWQYNANVADTDIVYDSAAFTSAEFSDFWGKFAAAINAATGSDQRVAFDLINEPHLPGNGRVGITLANWFSYAQFAINDIRAAGAANTVFVAGMDYTATTTFTTNGSAARWLTLADPAKNVAASAHCYLDSADLSPTAIVDACSAFVSWARTNGAKVNVAEIAINAGPNGRATTCSSFAAAQAQWSNWTAFCAANNDVLVGWNWWANSEAGWWNEGDSCDPKGYHWGLTLDNGVTQTVYMDLIDSSILVPIL